MTISAETAHFAAIRHDTVTCNIVDAALQIHRDLGPGLLESVYESILSRELVERGLKVERQRVVDFKYRGIVYREGFRVDLIVDDWVVVELKSIEKIGPVHTKQLLTYMKLLDLPVGLLVNFGGVTLREGLKRVVNSRGARRPRYPVFTAGRSRGAHDNVPGAG